MDGLFDGTTLGLIDKVGTIDGKSDGVDDGLRDGLPLGADDNDGAFDPSLVG
jgi:hypothetical protein